VTVLNQIHAIRHNVIVTHPMYLVQISFVTDSRASCLTRSLAPNMTRNVSGQRVIWPQNVFQYLPLWLNPQMPPVWQ
jgi:hypothetical protein